MLSLTVHSAGIRIVAYGLPTQFFCNNPVKTASACGRDRNTGKQFQTASMIEKTGIQYNFGYRFSCLDRLSACGEGDTVDFDRNQVFRIDRLVEVVGDADMVVSRTACACGH